VATSDLLSLLAFTVSLLALAIGSFIGLRQARLAQSANRIAVLISQMNDFRLRKFNEDHIYLVKHLPKEHNSQLGISGLPEEVRNSFYNVVYFYQILAVLVILRALNKREILTLYQRRVVELWDAVEPFVKQERKINKDEDGDLLRNVEAFALAARHFRPSALRRRIDRVWKRRPVF
jgi:hypothetical protein